MLKAVVAFAASVLILLGDAAAGPLEDATTAYRNGDYEEVVRLLRPLAEAGDVTAQFNLGHVYDETEGPVWDHAEAVGWFSLAARQGDEHAKLRLAFALMLDLDFAGALEALQPLAEQGGASAQYFIGDMYLFGRGVEKDVDKAAEWYRRAAERGHAGGQATLGLLYETGTAVPADDVEAAKWYRLAALQDHTGGEEGLGKMYFLGKGVPEDVDVAAKFLGDAASKGSPDGQFLLGLMHANGDGVVQDFVLAHMWLNLSGTDDGKRILGDLVGEMTSEQIAEAQRMAREWTPESEEWEAEEFRWREPLGSSAAFGLSLAELTPELRSAFALGSDVTGLIVTSVAEDSPAAEKSIEAGDVLIEIWQKPVSSLDDFHAAVAERAASGSRVMLLLARPGGDHRFVTLATR